MSSNAKKGFTIYSDDYVLSQSLEKFKNEDTKLYSRILEALQLIGNFSTKVNVELYESKDTEEEKYFYNAAVEILKRNGVCIAAKLPYDNNQANKYVATDLSISIFESDELSSADDTIKIMLSFGSNSQNGLGRSI